MSFRQFVLHLSSQASWVWVILTPIRSESRSNMMVGTYFQELQHWSILWPDKVMSCLTHLAGGPIVISFPFLARLAILPWGNCKTYSISCSWWILCVSKVWSLPIDDVNAISKHVTGTPIFNKNIWSIMLNFLYQLSKHRCMGNVMKFLSPYLKSFLHYILSWISCSACPWEGYTRWNMCLNTFSFPLFCLIW